MPLPNLWAFSAVTVPLVLTPGASTAVVLRNSLDGGRRAGVETAVGVNAGSIAYGALTAAGLSFVLDRWSYLVLVLRVAGMLYLAWLAWESLLHARKGQPSRLAARGSGARAPERRHHLSEGFMTNVLNPSIAAFYLLIVPQFIPTGASFAAMALILTATHVTIAFTCHLAWAFAGGTLAPVLDGPRASRILHIVIGAAMLALAIKVALA